MSAIGGEICGPQFASYRLWANGAGSDNVRHFAGCGDVSGTDDGSGEHCNSSLQLGKMD
jgi:hypothetical protein